MARYLVVVHELVSNPKLVEKLKEIAKQDDTAEFVLLVPASPVRHLLLWKTDTATEQEAAEHRQAQDARRSPRQAIKLVATRIGADAATPSTRSFGTTRALHRVGHFHAAQGALPLGPAPRPSTGGEAEASAACPPRRGDAQPAAGLARRWDR